MDMHNHAAHAPTSAPPRLMDPKTDPAVVCEKLCVRLGGRDVLHDVGLTVARGAFLPIVGPNGAGKTSLLRTIIGLLEPRTGTVRISGGAGGIGYVPQQKRIDPIFPLAVADIVAMGLGLRRPERRQGEAAVLDACKRIGIGDLLSRDFASLSGGQKQRALIARALVTGADILVFDEPASELDEEAECALLDLLADMCRNDGCTILIAHHGLSHIRLHAPDVCLVRQGRVTVVPSSEAVF